MYRGGYMKKSTYWKSFAIGLFTLSLGVVLGRYWYSVDPSSSRTPASIYGFTGWMCSTLGGDGKGFEFSYHLLSDCAPDSVRFIQNTYEKDGPDGESIKFCCLKK